MIGFHWILIVAATSLIVGIAIGRRIFLQARAETNANPYRSERHRALRVAGLILALYGFTAILPLFADNIPLFADDSTEGGLLNKLGTYGDMFGLFNSLFTGLAFAGIFYTVLIQQKQRELQEEEIDFLKAPAEAGKAELALEERDDNRLLTRVKGTGDHVYDACYIRVCVSNRRDAFAKGCRAYLTGIDVEVAHAYVKVPFFQNALRLRWSLEDDRTPREDIEIQRYVSIYIYVFSVKDERNPPGCGNQYNLIQMANEFAKYHLYNNQLKENTECRFRILVVADNANPLLMSLHARLKVEWNEPYIMKLESMAAPKSLARGYRVSQLNPQYGPRICRSTCDL